MNSFQLDIFRTFMKGKGITFGDCTQAFGESEEHWAVKKALNSTLLSNGVLELDVPAVISERDEGAYVMAWLWVRNPEYKLDKEPSCPKPFKTQPCWPR